MEMLLNAETIGDVDYMELDQRVSNGASLTKTERITHERNHFERTIGMELDADLVAMNLDGRLLQRVVTLAGIVSIWSKEYLHQLVDTLLAPTSQPSGRLQDMKPELLLAALMRASGLTSARGFDTDVSVSLDSVARFVAICRENRTVIEETFGEPLRDDFAEKPVRQLNRFLGRIGLALVTTNTKKIAGRKIRYYGVPAEMLEKMTRLARSYLEVKARKEAARERARDEGRKRIA
jgi:hypothetical protein